MPQNYRIVDGNVNGDAAPAIELFAAITDKTLSVRNITISNSATAVVAVTIEQASGDNLIGPIYLAVNATWSSPNFEPGSFRGDVGAAINVLASTSNVITASGEAYVS